MYCPHCGVNNDRNEAECYICQKALPALEAPQPLSPGRPQFKKPAAATEKPATVGDRTLALLFDRVMLAAVLGAAAASAGTRPEAFQAPSAQFVSAAVGAVLLIPFLYHLLLEGIFKTTIGKAMMGLEVRTLPGRGPFAAALLRNLLRIVDSIAFYLVGFLVAMFTRNGQRIGDLVAGTVVMERPVRNLWRAAMMVLWLVVVVGAAWWAWSTGTALIAIPARAL